MNSSRNSAMNDANLPATLTPTISRSKLVANIRWRMSFIWMLGFCHDSIFKSELAISACRDSRCGSYLVDMGIQFASLGRIIGAFDCAIIPKPRPLEEYWSQQSLSGINGVLSLKFAHNADLAVVKTAIYKAKKVHFSRLTQVFDFTPCRRVGDLSIPSSRSITPVLLPNSINH